MSGEITAYEIDNKEVGHIRRIHSAVSVHIRETHYQKETKIVYMDFNNKRKLSFYNFDHDYSLKFSQTLSLCMLCYQQLCNGVILARVKLKKFYKFTSDIFYFRF